MDRPIDARLKVVRRFRHRLAADPRAFAAAASGVLGTPVAEALAAEVLPLADACRFLEREAGAILKPRRLGSEGRPAWLLGVSLEIRREPLGRVLIVGAHNYPLLLAGVQALQALVAGNSVVLKPGHGGGPAARALAGGLAASGLPEGLLTVLDESPAAVRAAIAEGVDKVVLTGSASTGRIVLGELAPHGVPSVMELSGCDACVVLDGADVDRLVRSLVFGLRFKGSATCIAPRRIYGPHTLLADVERRLVDQVRTVAPRPLDRAAADRVRACVVDAVASGARLVAGDPAEGDRFRPVVIADARTEMAIAREDLFAPIVALFPVEGEDAAVVAANACPYALGASVFGPSAAALRIAERLAVGCVTIDDVIAPTGDPRLPFGGRGASGFGVTRGAEGLLEMTAIKAIAVRRGTMVQHLDPAWLGDEDLLTGYLLAAHGSGWAERAAGAWRAVSAVARHLSRRA